MKKRYKILCVILCMLLLPPILLVVLNQMGNSLAFFLLQNTPLSGVGAIGKYYGPEDFVLYIDGIWYCCAEDSGGRKRDRYIGRVSAGNMAMRVWRAENDPEEIYLYASTGREGGWYIRSDQPHGEYCWFCDRTKPFPWEPK